MEETSNNENVVSTDANTLPAHFRLPVKQQLLVLSVVLVTMFTLGGASVYLAQPDEENNKEEVIPASMATSIEARQGGETFSELSLQAESALVIDLKENKVLYEKEADTQRPLASITKLMTALVAKELVSEGDVIPVTAAALEQSGDSGLSLGERFSYQKMSDLVLLMSSNDGAYALAAAAGSALDPSSPEAAFVRAMNVRARELGLEETTFRNPTGLDITEDEAGAYGTAREVAELMAYIVTNYPDLLEETTNSESLILSENGSAHDANNTNRVVGEFAQVIGSKTGYTTLAGGNLVMAFDAGFDHEVVAVVLGSTYQGRFSDMVKLVEASLHEINSQNQ